MASPVSLCMIVKNEEANLAACLAPVVGLVGEVVVVDTGSSDRTRELARELGARVSEFAWVDDFAAARNASLDEARLPWIFWLDADDRVEEADRERLQALFRTLGDENAAYIMSCRGISTADETTFVTDHIRLFRRDPAVRWRYRVHEQIRPALQRAGADIRPTDIVIRHTGYQQEASRPGKIARDFRLLELALADDPHDPHAHFYLGRAHLMAGAVERAVPLLRQCAAAVHPSNPLAPAAYTLFAQALLQTGALAEALTVCRAGLIHFPDNLELLFLEGNVRQKTGDQVGAEACLRVVAGGAGVIPQNALDTSVPMKARHRLAAIALASGRLDEAEALWSAVLAEAPDYRAAWLGRADVCAARGSSAAALLDALDRDPRNALNRALVEARILQNAMDYGGARAVLEQACAAHPLRLDPRLALARLLLRERRDWMAAAQALRGVLELEPGHREATANLAILRQHGLIPPT